MLLHGCQLDNSCDFSIGAEVVDLFELTSALVKSSENDDNFHFFPEFQSVTINHLQTESGFLSWVCPIYILRGMIALWDKKCWKQ